MLEQKTFDLASLNNPKIKTNAGLYPAFFAILQTGINSTQWKGSDLELIQLVKGQLEALRVHCESLVKAPAPVATPEAPKEDGVQIAAPSKTLEEAIKEPIAPVAPKPNEPIAPDKCLTPVNPPAVPAKPATQAVATEKKK